MEDATSISEFVFQIIKLNPALAGIFILIFLSGYLVFFSNYQVNRWKYFEKLENWEKPLWVLLFGLLNSLYAILALGMWLMIIALTSAESLKVVKDTDLYNYFIIALFVIPASEFLSLQLKINRVVSLSVFSVVVLGSIVSTTFINIIQLTLL